MSMYIDDLVIEVTRNCNMGCAHCLRGDPQKLTMNRLYFRRLLREVDYINSLTLTGGEPSLVPHKIEEVIDEVRRAGTIVNRFYLVTNAKRITRPFLEALQRLEWLVQDPEESYVVWSNDRFHEAAWSGVYKLEEWFEQNMRSNFGPKDGPNTYGRRFRWEDDPACILDMGRASMNMPALKALELGHFQMSDGRHVEEGVLYLNCKGVLLSSCDLSYELQDLDSAFVVGRVTDESFHLPTAFKNYPHTTMCEDAEAVAV